MEAGRYIYRSGGVTVVDNQAGESKKDLEDQDLAPVLKRLMTSAYRASPEGRRRLANSVMTKEFLEAGLRIVTREFSAEEPQDSADRPFLEWISQNKLTAEVAAKLGKKVSPGQLRERWPEHRGFLADLLAYSLWSENWLSHGDIAEDAAKLLVSGADLPALVDQVAYDYIRHWSSDPVNKMSLLVAATADRDPAAREAAQELYRVVHHAWKPLYEATLNHYGIRLRADVSMDDFTDIVGAFAEGIGLRIMADPQERFIDHKRKQSMLGRAILVAIVGCAENVEETLADSVRRLCR